MKTFKVHVYTKVDEVWLVDAEDIQAAKDAFYMGELTSSLNCDHEVQYVEEIKKESEAE